MADEMVVFGAEDVERFIRDAVGSALEGNSVENRVAYNKKWLTKDELKELTGWSDRTIQNLRDSRQIPFSQHGRKIVYPTKGIGEFLQSHVVETSRSWELKSTELLRRIRSAGQCTA